MKKDIWISEEWKKNPNICNTERRTGLRLRIDNKTNPAVKDSFIKISKWIRERFCFPIRVPVYVKASKTVRAKDGEHCVGIFFEPDDYKWEPYIRIATGDYEELVNERGELQAKIAVLLPLLHELTHYYQWLNAEQLTSLGKERQASRYAKDIMEEYLDDIDLLPFL